jgi:pyrroline-5-carboxylate reductase
VSASLAVALEGVEQGAVEAGLPRDKARVFARQALAGSALLMRDISESPAALKDRVASPGGTTIAGLAVLEDQGIRGTLIRAVEQVVQGAVEGRDK